MKIYLNGKFYAKDQAKISVFDHGLLYGDGVFEGIRAYNGKVFKLKEHLKRLYHSARAITLNIPLNFKNKWFKRRLYTFSDHAGRGGFRIRSS